MIAHQAKGMYLPAGFYAGLGQGFDEVVPVHVVEEDVIPLVATTHDMVNRAGILESQFAGHGQSIAAFAFKSRSIRGLFYGLTPPMTPPT